MFNQNGQQKSSPKRPDHTARLTKSLGVCVWTSHDSETGQMRMHWKVERVDSKDSSKMYSTLSVASILEFPRFLSKLCYGMAQTEAVSPRLKSELVGMGKDMEQLAEKREANGHAPEGSSEPVTVPF